MKKEWVKWVLGLIWLLSVAAAAELPFTGQAFEGCMQANCAKYRGRASKWGRCYQKRCTGTGDMTSTLAEFSVEDDLIDLGSLEEASEIPYPSLNDSFFAAPTGYIPMPGFPFPTEETSE